MFTCRMENQIWVWLIYREVDWYCHNNGINPIFRCFDNLFVKCISEFFKPYSNTKKEETTIKIQNRQNWSEATISNGNFVVYLKNVSQILENLRSVQHHHLTFKNRSGPSQGLRIYEVYVKDEQVTIRHLGHGHDGFPINWTMTQPTETFKIDKSGLKQRSE